MEDIPNYMMYIMLIILVIILIMFILKHHFNWKFSINISKKENKLGELEMTKQIEQKKIEQEKKQIIDDTVKSVEDKIENFEEVEKEKIPDEIKVIEEKEDPAVKISSLEKMIEDKVNQEVNNRIKKFIDRNNGEREIRKKFGTYNVMLNEPVGRLKQSKLMIDQLIDDKLERYYGYVKPISIEDNNKTAYNANTFCIKCDSKDQEYSGYFYSDPLEYANDKLEGSDEGIKAYNI